MRDRTRPNRSYCRGESGQGEFDLANRFYPIHSCQSEGRQRSRSKSAWQRRKRGSRLRGHRPQTRYSPSGNACGFRWPNPGREPQRSPFRIYRMRLRYPRSQRLGLPSHQSGAYRYHDAFILTTIVVDPCEFQLVHALPAAERHVLVPWNTGEERFADPGCVGRRANAC